ncbi:hypothetical protein Dsin_015781 [Dipteronia sinensis]|uniref:Uncharacterized protein n=1 Tax=Dipteronia sinensis TaxID=43782 RepID=A0AAE0AD78_9ROSI|nr:hypothetical protein Dsin_015781 [Dipteronia sinensis]
MLIMKTLINPSIPSPLHFSKPNSRNQKPLKTHHLCCFRKNGEVNGFSKPTSQMESGGHDNTELSQKQSLSSNVEPEMKHNDIWGLFREAQQNILYLNRQRLRAVEELNKANQEKQLLLDKIQQFEAENHGGSGKGASTFDLSCSIVESIYLINWSSLILFILVFFILNIEHVISCFLMFRIL